MARLITIRQKNGSTPAPASLPDIPAVGLAANVISTTEIDLVASYAGPPTKATFTFQFATSLGGPYTTLATQSSATYQHTGLTQSTTYFYRVNVQTTETPSRTGAWSAIQSATTQSTVTPGFYWVDLAWGTSDPLNPLRFSNRAFSGTNGWADIVGVDSVTGQLHPPESTKGALWGGTPPYPTSVQCIGTTPLTDQLRSIISTTLHDGSTGNCYRNSFVAPYVGKPVGGNQNDYIPWPDTSNGVQGMVYVRKWVRLQSDFQSRMTSAQTTDNGVTSNAAGFFVLSSSKTAASSARVQLSIVTNNAAAFANPTQAYFQVDFDGFIGNTTYSSFRYFAIGPNPIPTPTTGNNSGVRVGPFVPVTNAPTNNWMLVEHAFRQSAGSDGWCWVAINGVEIFLSQGPNMDPSFAGEKINRLLPHQCYSNLNRVSSPFNYDLGRFQIATAFPPDATARSQALS